MLNVDLGLYDSKKRYFQLGCGGEDNNINILDLDMNELDSNLSK